MYRYFIFVLLLIGTGQSTAQDLEPRRWTALPPGINVIGAGYIVSQGDIYLDPVLKAEDVEVSGHLVGVSYVRSFKIAKKPARFDATVPWGNMRWSGLLDGEAASTERVGLADPIFRLSVLLAGAPTPGAARDPSKKSNTTFGIAIAVSVPLGEYQSDKLINLGRNSAYIRPQLGVLHTRGQWSYELTGSTFIYEKNDDFFDGQSLQQDPLYAVQGHIIRVFDKPGYWAALSTGYGWKGETVIDGVRSDNSQKKWLSSLAFGMPTGKNHGIKIAYLRNRTKTDTGADIDSLGIAWSMRF